MNDLKFKLGRFPWSLIAARQEICCSRMSFIIFKSIMGEDNAEIFNEPWFPFGVTSKTQFLSDLLTLIHLSNTY